MKYLLIVISLTLFGCGEGYKTPGSNSTPDSNEETPVINHQQVVEDLKDSSMTDEDMFSALTADYINSNGSSMGSDEDGTFLNLNQGGETEQYVQTTRDLNSSDQITISIWFKTTDPYSIQTLLWQGVSDQNGWGAGSPDPTKCEFNITLNHWSDSSGQALSVFYGYDESPDTSSSSVELQPVGFPVAKEAENGPFSFSGVPVVLNYDWNHVAVVMDKNPTSVEISLYYNGQFVQSQIGTQVDTTQWDSNFRIGRPGANTRKFSGQVSNFFVFDTLLSASEIESIYQYGRH